MTKKERLIDIYASTYDKDVFSGNVTARAKRTLEILTLISIAICILGGVFLIIMGFLTRPAIASALGIIEGVLLGVLGPLSIWLASSLIYMFIENHTSFKAIAEALSSNSTVKESPLTFICPSCEETLSKGQNPCPKCGKPISW